MVSEDRYLKDEEISKDSGGLIGFDNLIMAGVISAGAMTLYKNGAFRGSILKMAKGVNNGSLKSITKLHETRAWLSATSVGMDDSLLRTGAVRRIMQIKDKKTLKKIYHSTIQDSKKVMQILKDETSIGSKLLKRYSEVSNETNFEIFNELAQGNAAIDEMVAKNKQAKQSMQGLIYENIISRYKLDDIKGKESMYRNGYKTATLEDLFNIQIGQNGRINLTPKGNVKGLNNLYGNEKSRQVKYLEAMLNGDVVNVDGKIKAKGGQKIRRYQDFDYKKLIVDNSIKVTDAGDILDLRSAKANVINSVRALGTEFKVPVLGINPLKMVGLDKFAKKEVKFGYIGEDAVAPHITLVRGNSKEHTIRALKKKGHAKLHDADSGVMVINGDVYKTVNGKVKKIDYESKKRLHISYQNKGQSGFGDINQLEYSQLKMMGISNVESSSFSGSNNVANKILNVLDIGKQDKMSKVENTTAFNYIDPDNMIGDSISRVVNKISQRDVKYYERAHDMIYKDGSDGRFGTVFVTSKSFSFREFIKNPTDPKMMDKFINQFFADFSSNPEDITNVTAAMHFLTDRLSTTLGNVGLGLSEDNNTGPMSRMTDILTKRMLPIFGVYAGWQALNTITEGTDEEGYRTNVNRWALEMYASMDVGFSKIKDMFGVTNIAKNINELLPGFDQISELPGLNLIHLDETAKERAQYWEDGKDIVRKGRYWSLSSNVSYTGGKIDYFRMNPLQRAKSDAVFSDSQFGSRWEYITNLLNPYHYDLKHYYDRPYLKTSPAFENVPVFGEVLSGTIGKFIKPQINMHKEYWKNYNTPYTTNEINNLAINDNVENSRLVSQNISDVLTEKAVSIAKDIYKENFFSKFLSDAIESANKMLRNALRPPEYYPSILKDKIPGDNEKYHPIAKALEPYTHTISGNNIDIDDVKREINKQRRGMYAFGVEGNSDFHKNLSYILSQTNYYSSNLAFQEYTPYTQPVQESVPGEASSVGSIQITPTDAGVNYQNKYQFDKKYDLSNQNFLYRTGSGKYQVINSKNEKDPFVRVNVNKDSAQQFAGQARLGTQGFLPEAYLTHLEEKDMLKPNSLEHTVRTAVADSLNVAGIYGYGVSTLFTGDTREGMTVVETPSYSRSINKRFWDQDLGGLSGDISEIFRRFVQKRKEYGVNYFNPVRNTMPEWLPGVDGFIDFQHGDAFSKVKNGEERLPGEGYERAYGIDINDYKISSSKIGGDVNSIIKYFLHRDGITDEEQQSIVKKGTRMHESIEKYMEKNHISLDSEQTVYDIENNISGIYDVRIKDYTSISGEAIVDIKSISDKGFQKVLQTGKPKEEHVKQVNFYLHNTNKNHNGGVLYVNRDDPTQVYMTSFKYSKKLYEETINNVNQARHEVQSAIASGQISSAERYRPIDKFRILADVAPHSQEFNDMKTYISSLNLEGAQKEEFDKINDRVIEQRRQLRTYEYKFKTSDVIELNGKVDVQMDTDMFKIKGYDNPIKFAGIKIKSLNDYIKEGYSSKEAQMKVDEAKAFISENVSGNITFNVAQDTYHRINKDTYKTMDAVIYNGNKDINKQLVKKGYAIEDNEDFSAPAVHTRFNTLERLVGSAWETIAHQNTIFNNKILRVRSAKEEYERQMTYGVDFKSWTKPIENYVKPMVWQAGREESMDSRVIAGLSLGILGAMSARRLGKIKLKELPIKSLKAYRFGETTVHASILGATTGATVGFTMGGSLLGGIIVGSAFGGVGSRGTFGRLLGATVGASTVIGAKIYRTAYEKKNNKTWVSKEKRHQSETIDYIDKLKYIRNRRLFEIYAKKALVEDGIDVKKILYQSKQKADKSKSFSNKVKRIKVDQKRKGKFNKREYEKVGVKFNKKQLKQIKKEAIDKVRQDEAKRFSKIKNDVINGGPYENNVLDITKRYARRTKEEIAEVKKRQHKYLSKEINKVINKPSNTKELSTTSYNAMKAIEYYNESEKTMYAYDPGDSLTDFLKALPKRDIKFFNEFLKAGEEEREEILKITPKYMTRALQSAYGKEVYEKDNLVEYFSNHYLPDENWVGWQEGFDFNVVETKMLNKAEAPLTEYGKWDDDIKRANAYGNIPIPNMSYKTSNINLVKRQLAMVLGDAGYRDIHVDVTPTSKPSSINLQLVDSRSAKLKNAILERMNSDE